MEVLTKTTRFRPRPLVPGMGVVVLAAGALLAITGCQQQTQSETQSGVRPAQTASDAPENSSADEAKEKTGAGESGAGQGVAMAAAPHSTKLNFSSTPASLPVGKAATWTLQINDAQSGQPVKDFSVVHDKLMHLIVVKKDLSWFNHIHPQHKGGGAFTVTTALPTAGDYKLYADYTPKGKAQEVPQHEFSAGTATTAVAPQLVPDKMQGAWMTKKVVAHPEGEPNAKGGATYEVALMPMPMPLKAGEDSMLHFQVRDAKGTPIKDLQPYLGAMGHCVILSSDTKSYLHSHPMEGGMEGGGKHDMSKMGEMKHSAPPKSGGPDVMFHTNFPTAGLYKAWGQFMHKGKIITAAFVVNVGAAKGGATKDSTHDHDESQPHAH